MTGKGDARDNVYKYLKDQNRPYSANDVVQNLHNEFGKTVVQKALDDLVRDNQILEKVYGKQKIYSVVQETEDRGGDAEAELMQLDSRIEELTGNLRKAENDLKGNETTLRDLRRQPSMEECSKEKKELEEEIKKLTEKIQTLSKSNCTVTEKERIELCKENENYKKEYRKRKRICMDILNSILESCPKPKKALFEEIGIETDEDVGFKIMT